MIELDNEQLTPSEQIKATFDQYAAVLLPAGLDISEEQATELAGLALKLAHLHRAEAIEWRKRAAFWSGYRPRN